MSLSALLRGESSEKSPPILVSALKSSPSLNDFSFGAATDLAQHNGACTPKLLQGVGKLLLVGGLKLLLLSDTHHTRPRHYPSPHQSLRRAGLCPGLVRCPPCYPDPQKCILTPLTTERLAQHAQRREDAAATRHLADSLANTQLSLRRPPRQDYETAARAVAEAAGHLDLARPCTQRPPQQRPSLFAPSSCPPASGMANWADAYELRSDSAVPSVRAPVDQSTRRPTLSDYRRRSLDAAPAPPSPTTLRFGSFRRPSTSPSPSPPPSPPSSLAARAAAMATAPHSSLSMDKSVKEALLCSTSF